MSFDESAIRALPLVWVLTGPRRGETAQQRVVAEALGVRVEEKAVHAAKAGKGFGWHPRLASKSGLEPPWPAATLSFGKTLAAALWVQRASHGRTRLVHLGRPRGVRPDLLDLLIPMPQDRVPAAGNVVNLKLPLNRPARLHADFCASTLAKLSLLPRPRCALLIGGDSKHCRTNLVELIALIRCAARGVAAEGGSLLLSTSPRTPRAWTRALRQAAPAYGHFYAFERDDDARNPLAAYLALADEFIVSGDSASMLAECWRTGKPVRVWAPSRTTRLREALRERCVPRGLDEALVRRGIWSARVDLLDWLNTLVGNGVIGLVGRSAPQRFYRADADDDLVRVVSRIRALLGV